LKDEQELGALPSEWRQRMLISTLIPGWPADPKTSEMSYWLKLGPASTDKINAAAVEDGVPVKRTHHARKVSLPGISWMPLAPESPLCTVPIGTTHIISAKQLKSKIVPNNLQAGNLC